jgi:hypothetical protein
MAKKIKKISEDLPKDEELLADAPEPKEEKPKTFLGYHPITGAEVWQ